MTVPDATQPKPSSNSAPATKGKKGVEENKEELSDEDQELKRNLELCVERCLDVDPGVVTLALNTIRTEIRTATTSMTSVPKPLKFLRPHYDELKKTFDAMKTEANRAILADIISVLATTHSTENERDCLLFRLRGTTEDVGAWGHEYVRTLSGQLGKEWQARQEKEEAVDDLMHLMQQIVPYQMKHYAEPEVVDMLLEVERLDLLEAHVDDKNYQRTCLYLVSCCHYLPEPEDMTVLSTAFKLYMKMRKHHDAMRVALMMNNRDCIHDAFNACANALEKKQLCYMLARQGVVLDLDEGPTAIDDQEVKDSLQEVISNAQLSEHFLALARDLDVMESKLPDDVYKMHLVEGRHASAPSLDSARQNLASTFVNALVNAGYGQDKLVTTTPEEGQTHWIFNNKDHGKMSATASVGMITMWDSDNGLPMIDKYFHSSDSFVVGGACLAVGIIFCCVQNDCDPAYALLCESVSARDTSVRLGAIMGLGLAYAGTCKQDVHDLLLPIITDLDQPMEVAGFAAMSMGLVFVSTSHQDSVEAILQALMTRPDAHLESPWAKLMCLGLALLFLGKQDVVEATMEVAKTLNEKISKYCQVVLDTVAYAGTGNVLKVQELLALCGEHVEAGEGEAWKAAHQLPAVVGIGLIAMGEDLGAGMAQRALEHLLQYGESPVRRAVPLAIALLHASNPDIYPMDTLSRLSHDADLDVAANAIIGLGVMGAGTNNARLAGMLRQLSSYYYKEPVMLYLVRIAQGLVHMAKGLMTVNPYHTDRQLLSGVALAGLLGVLHACCMDTRTLLAGSHHYMLYYIAAAMKPRMLLTVDESGKLLPVAVRVGQAVDVVAQAGRPKTITGFQTYTTPVLLGVDQRAELATEKYIPLSPVLEGVVILQPNPDYIEDDHEA